jgi:PTH1 family peptidyl-tRNA hydrolase
MSDLIESIDKIEPQAPKRQGPFLIAGLGNPGREFEFNRHNAGFMLLNRLASKLGESFRKVEARALVSKTIYQGERIIMIKPQTYMNNSGSAVSSLMRFYKVPLENLLVIYDDVDLPLGSLRLRGSGGSAGQKGMQSIIERMGTEEIPRLRIGTGRLQAGRKQQIMCWRIFTPQETDLVNETWTERQSGCLPL